MKAKTTTQTAKTPTKTSKWKAPNKMIATFYVNVAGMTPKQAVSEIKAQRKLNGFNDPNVKEQWFPIYHGDSRVEYLHF